MPQSLIRSIDPISLCVGRYTTPAGFFLSRGRTQHLSGDCVSSAYTSAEQDTVIVTSEAIVLKTRKYRESSKLVSIYTRDHGKCSLVAKGSRRVKSALGSPLEPLACSHVTFYKRRNADLHTAAKAETAVSFRNLSESFDKLTLGLTMAEAINNTQMADDAHPELYDFFKACLLRLDSAGEDCKGVLLYFYFGLSDFLGFAMSPKRCPRSNSMVDPASSAWFAVSLADGAPLTTQSAGDSAGPLRLRSETLRYLQALADCPDINGFDAACDARIWQELRDLFSRYFVHHLDKPVNWRTDQFLAAMSGVP